MVDKKPNELGFKHKVCLLDKAYRVHYPVCSLTIYGYLPGNQPLSGLSQIFFPLKMATLDNIPPVVILIGVGYHPFISGINVYQAENGRRRNIHLMESNTDMYEWFLFGGFSPPIQRPLENHYVRGVEILHHLLVVRSHTPSKPLELVVGE